jgi:hypothetical protein
MIFEGEDYALKASTNDLHNLRGQSPSLKTSRG